MENLISIKDILPVLVKLHLIILLKVEYLIENNLQKKMYLNNNKIIFFRKKWIKWMKFYKMNKLTKMEVILIFL